MQKEQLMMLERLSMYRGYNKEFSGTLSFKNSEAEISLSLKDEDCQKILKICADRLVETSKELANNLTSNVISAQKVLAEEIE